MLTKQDLSQIKRLFGNIATKDDLKNFATKNDLESLASKDDLRSVKQDISAIRKDVKTIVNFFETPDFTCKFICPL